MITTLFVGLLGLAVTGVVFLLAARRDSGHGRGGPTLLARVLTMWVAATVFFTSYFGSLHIPGLFDLTVERATFCILLGLMAVRLYQGQVRGGLNPVIEILMGLFLCLCLASMSVHGFLASQPGVNKPWYIFLEGYLLPFFGFVGVKYFLTEEADLRCLIRGLFWIGVAIAITSLMEGLGLRQYVLPTYIHDKTVLLHLDRARGPFLNAAFSGLALCIGLIAGLMLLPLTRLPASLLHYTLLLLFLPAVYYTRTRSVYLQLVLIVLGVVLAMRTTFPKWKVYALPCFVAVLLLVTNLGRLGSADRDTGGLAEMQEIAIRFELARKSLTLIGEHPFFGVGLAQFRTADRALVETAEYQHNHLIGLAAELGLPGLGLYLAIIALVFVRLFRLMPVMPEGRFLNANFLFLTGLALLCNLTSNTFVEPSMHAFANLNFFLFAGLVDRLSHEARGLTGTQVPGGQGD